MILRKIKCCSRSPLHSPLHLMEPHQSRSFLKYSFWLGLDVFCLIIVEVPHHHSLYITGNLGRANNIQLMTSFISSLNACNFVILWVLSPHFHTPVPNNKCIKSSSAEKMSWRLSFTEWHSGFRNNIDIKAAFFWILTTFLKNLSFKCSINLLLQKLKTFFFRYLKFIPSNNGKFFMAKFTHKIFFAC